MIIKKSDKERSVESHLRFYNTYLIGIKNLEQQLDFIMPSLVMNYGADQGGSYFFIPNNTANVALDRIESKRALDLREEIEKYKLITSSIENALQDLKPQEMEFVNLRYFERNPMHEVKIKMGYAEEKSVYRIRRLVLDKLLISLNNLLSLK